MISADVGWSDLGSWGALRDALSAIAEADGDLDLQIWGRRSRAALGFRI